jgi:hypothetical protein
MIQKGLQDKVLFQKEDGFVCFAWCSLWKFKLQI